MKLSVSLPDEDIEFLDSYAEAHDVATRSAVLRRAVRLLKEAELEDAYAAAMAEWVGSEDAKLWDMRSGDGLTAEPPRAAR